MSNSVVRTVYNWGPTRWVLATTGLDRHVRRCYTRLQEARTGTRDLVLDGTSVELSERALPDEEYLEPEKAVLEDLLGELRQDDVFWDVGADKGLYTCPAGKKITDGSTVAFEPHPVRRGELRRNAHRNDVTATIRTEALSAVTGEAAFGYRIEPDGAGGEFTATLTRGDELLRRGAVEPPTVVKIDVEGAELDVLQGLDETVRRTECRLVYVELHNRIADYGGSWGELKDYLRDRGFAVETVAERIGEDFRQPFIKAGKEE